MSATTSLRRRLILGAALWIVGVTAVAALVAIGIITHHQSSAVTVHNWFIGVASLAALVIGLAQLRLSLSPFDALRTRLLDVRQGRATRVEGAYPAEVQPLVTELNALLEERAQAVVRAQAKAGDLAHGLRTPLAVLTEDAAQLADAGQTALAASIDQQITRMRRHVEHHLASARAAAAGRSRSARTSVAESAEGLARTLRRLHDLRGVTIDVRVAPDTTVQCERADLDEMLGNLMDNACRYARSQVIVSASVSPDGGVAVVVEDDGPGIAPALRARVLERGVRADESTTGFGLGLAIVRDLVDVYGGTITLEPAPGGGTRAVLALGHQLRDDVRG